MNIDNLFGIHEQALNLRIKRAEILASNMANADTPGFKAKDMEFNDVLKGISSNQSSKLVATDPKHLTAGASNMDVELFERAPLQTSLDGNTVDTQIESAKFAENNLRYLASLRIIDMKIKAFTTAIRGE